jgi:hypothetical protein
MPLPLLPLPLLPLPLLPLPLLESRVADLLVKEETTARRMSCWICPRT